MKCRRDAGWRLVLHDLLNCGSLYVFPWSIDDRAVFDLLGKLETS